MSSLFNPDELGPFQPPVILCHFCFTPPSWLSHTPQGCLLYAPAWLKSADLKHGLSTTRATKTFQITLFQSLFLSDWFSIILTCSDASNISPHIILQLSSQLFRSRNHVHIQLLHPPCFPVQYWPQSK